MNDSETPARRREENTVIIAVGPTARVVNVRMYATAWLSWVSVSNSGIDAVHSTTTNTDIAMRRPTSAPSHSASRAGSPAMRCVAMVVKPRSVSTPNSPV